ncbi:hypothetical protein GIY23_17755 [Allosaccharopolyspora coralli]|uniref:DUF695 domain-containing protein n=1 Tax=Allosaccharopolyspora coralli TaxID=2665642 RepID=A0A5Q3QJW6_9PSEU|nr:hypothetical protein [Allosaccharopolyspora coralli]QGK71117.1 hypothetical protein GIY23_17755 [Allosaccharopolyspora coralli]
MLKLFRRRDRTEREAGPDLADRVRAFWQLWDDELQPQVSAALGDGQPHRLDHPLAEAVASVHPDLIVSIEQGENALFALVVSAQADPELRAVTDAWKAAAPADDQNWEYHDSIPPVPDPTQVTVNLHGGQYALSQVRLAAQVDHAEGLVDVAVHHPGFADLEEAERTALTFLPLQAVLGERLAADRLGRVETALLEPDGAVGLLEFRDVVRSVASGPTTPDASA